MASGMSTACAAHSTATTSATAATLPMNGKFCVGQVPGLKSEAIATIIPASIILRAGGALSRSKWQVASTIIGVTSVAQLEEDVAAWNVQLSPELLAAIERGGLHRLMLQVVSADEAAAAKEGALPDDGAGDGQ